MSTAIDLQPVKGVRDVYPEEMRIRTWLFALWREVARRFGFEEYDACVLESEELYVRKAGDEITSQLYNFVDKGERRVALRPEITPSLMRMVLGRGAALPLPARWFAIPQCFRYENMQRGRKREHYQWNMDVVGLASVAAEAELMAAQAMFLREAGFAVQADVAKPDVVFQVSNRQVLGHLLGEAGVTGERFAAVCVAIDKRDKLGEDGVRSELFRLGVDDAVAVKVLALMNTAGPGKAGLAAIAAKVPASNPGLIQLTELLALLEGFGIAHLVRFDLSVVRGLSYYTGTVWEVFDATGTLPRAIAGGGRYDKLAETYGGKPMPMVGFGMGDVVIVEILRERSLLPPLRRTVDDVVFPMSSAEFAIGNRIARYLRKQGRCVLVDYSGRRFKHAVERAEAEGAGTLYVIGGNEVAAGKCTVKPLGPDAAKEHQVPLSALGAG